MIPRIRWLAVGVYLALLPACAQAVGTPSQPLPTASSQPQEPGWQVHFDISGGFAGVHRTLDLSNNGNLTAVDSKLAKQVIAQAPENDVRNIESQLDKMTSVQATGRLPACPDCFEYALDVNFRGQLYTARLNDRTLPGSGLEALVKALVDLQERALAGKLNP